MDVFEAMESAMTMRWLSGEPVPDDLIEKLIWAGTRAPSPENSQLWDFVVVTSPEQRARLHEAIVPEISSLDTVREKLAGAADPAKRRMGEGAYHLLATLREAPVLIFVCASSFVPGDPREDRYQFSAIYGATQNMLVAGRALGLGVAPTGIHHLNTRGVRAVLDMPEHKNIGMTVAVGWPTRPFRPVKRKPIADVTHFDTW
ncbi:nitroreductase family protein [Amycolatopsis sp. CA-230715]|uniref:nitroreductase family protein n=1 Tax=Amycolatopsis sp. CA-230715 TaxID=2745196 RepID=UPI001C012000|nr:nitroreductase family protein [Amycolatopsis sp. CA-230715]QWF77373.1 5,6-dimethylbenzimidazole synthase [Amycolatopsis sp. CA-230715]